MAQPSKKTVGIRGVVRPMELHQPNQSKMEMGPPDSQQRFQMLQMHHRQTQWVYWSIILLGIWMIVSPLTFSSLVGTVQPSGGRELWLSLDARAAILKWSDILSGGALLTFGWRSLKPNRPLNGWITCFIGVWLTFAPLIFWAPTAVQYLNDTFVGAWIIALSILIPGMPNMMMYMQMGPEKPPGWSYNPSSWIQRWILIALGLAGWLVSRYLAAYQLGYIDSVWDPFFAEGTREVLNSKMSHSLPISDAGLGSLAYTFEFLMGFMGSPARWRTMPWMVTLFGILVIPLGLVHIFLVISQPVTVGFWCTFCLLAAAIMLPMIPLEVDEVIAMGQFLRRSKKRGESLWKAFWKGGADSEAEPDQRSPEVLKIIDEPNTVLKASTWGMSTPWALLLTTIFGIWTVFSPGVLSLTKSLSDFNHVGGLLVITVSVLAMGEVIRIVRWINILVGFGLAAFPFFLSSPDQLKIHNVLIGAAIAALSLPKGKTLEEYGSWQKWVR